jgi:hypothetical protein
MKQKAVLQDRIFGTGRGMAAAMSELQILVDADEARSLSGGQASTGVVR